MSRLATRGLKGASPCRAALLRALSNDAWAGARTESARNASVVRMRRDYYVFDTPEIAPTRKDILRRKMSGVASGAVAVVFFGVVGAQMMSSGAEPTKQVKARAAEAPPPLAPRFAPRAYAELLDPSYSLGARPTTFRANESIAASPESAAPAGPIAAARMTSLREIATAAAPAVVADAAPPEVETMVAPLPAPRPVDLALAEPDIVPQVAGPIPPRRPDDLPTPVRPAPPLTAAKETKPAGVSVAARSSRRGRRATVVAAAPPQEPSLFQKLFGGGKSSGTAMAYAGQETGLLGDSGRLAGRAPAPAGVDAYTAVYDISRHTVYMPDGTRLEAHSGLGGMRDDPRHVNVRMRGATPPHLYDLTERERLFHGVRAIRLTPVGGTGAIHGRNGLLAHTYMLGPSGQSNGCVSFRDYNRFLQAFLNGRVKRLKVVASL